MNDYISIISSLIIFLFPYLGRKWFNPQLLSSTVVSLGLLGTFGGIMYGLWVFSVEQIDSSIPQLLEGLKTAFLTLSSCLSNAGVSLPSPCSVSLPSTMAWAPPSVLKSITRLTRRWP